MSSPGERRAEGRGTHVHHESPRLPKQQHVDRGVHAAPAGAHGHLRGVLTAHRAACGDRDARPAGLDRHLHVEDGAARVRGALGGRDDRVRRLGGGGADEHDEDSRESQEEATHENHRTYDPRLVHDPLGQIDLSAGKRTTSRIDSLPVSSITSRSIPRPIPPVGGIPYDSAST